MRHSRLHIPISIVVLTFGASLSGWTARAADAETPEQWRQRRERMSAVEKEGLLRKKERFEKLPVEEQARLRKFHEQILADPEGEQLRRVMERYYDWLKTLTSQQRFELASLSADERVPKIKEFQKVQEEQNFRRLVTAPLPVEDLDRIRAWIKDYALRNEDRLLSTLSANSQRWVREEKTSDGRLFRLRRALGQQGGGHFTAALAQEDEFKRLVGSLTSSEAQQALEAAREPEKKRVLVQEWLRAAVMAGVSPPASDQELQRFYAEELDQAKRDALELLPRGEMQRELRRIYNAQKFRREGDRPPGRGPGPPPFERPPGEGRGPRGGGLPGHRPDLPRGP